MDNIKYQNPVIFSFNNKDETNFYFQKTKYNEKI